jgi:hypothetical protein
MMSSIPNASAVRIGLRTASSFARISAFIRAASAPAAANRRWNATSTPPSTGSDPQSPDGHARRNVYR